MLLIVIFTIFLGSVSGHSYYWGSCPTVDPVENFNYTKILGRWFVVQRFSTKTPCWTYNFIDQNGVAKVIEAQNEIVNESNPDDRNYSTGTLTVPDTKTPGTMQVTYPTNIAGSANYVVFSTDYENYVGIFTCQKILLGYRMSVSIISRKLYLEQKYSSKARAKLATFGIDLHDLDVVDQSRCKYTTFTASNGTTAFDIPVQDITRYV